MKTTYPKVKICTISLAILISLAFATTLGFYGKINSITTIQPPKFYASTTKPDGSVYYSLYINNLPDEAKGTLTWYDRNSIFFVSLPINVTSWPPANWTIFLNIATNKVGSGIEIILEVIDKNLICSQQITLNSNSNETYEINCASDGISNMSPDDMLYFEVRGLAMETTTEYTIYADGTTRIEISYGSQGE